MDGSNSLLCVGAIVRMNLTVPGSSNSAVDEIRKLCGISTASGRQYATERVSSRVRNPI